MAKFMVTRKAEALVAATVETILQVVGGAAKAPKLLEVGVSFNGVSPSAVPALVELVRQTSAGTSSAATFRPLDGAASPVEITALSAFTAEPTDGGVILPAWYVTPNGGLFVYAFPSGNEITVPVTERLGLRATAPDAVSVTAYMVVEEP
jgi:hypothetical protein